MIWLVGLGGMVGSMLRYFCHLLINRYFPSTFPWGAFFVNITGCFFIGVIFGLSSKGSNISPEWKLFLATGFCGGFTTFSAFSLESMLLLQNGNYLNFSIYTIASVALGLTATIGGFMLMKMA